MQDSCQEASLESGEKYEVGKQKKKQKIFVPFLSHSKK